jgi:hypothetical protein
MVWKLVGGSYVSGTTLGDNGQIDDTRRTAQYEADLNRNDEGEKFNLAK